MNGFEEELKALCRNTNLATCTALFPLSPYLDHQELLRLEQIQHSRLLLNDIAERWRFGSASSPSCAFHHLSRWGAAHATNTRNIPLSAATATGSKYLHSLLRHMPPSLEETYRTADDSAFRSLGYWALLFFGYVCQFLWTIYS